jgi:hypothetical protein
MNLMTKRVNVSLPDPVFEDLKRLAEIRDQAAGTVAAILIEFALKDYKDRGELPSDKPGDDSPK